MRSNGWVSITAHSVVKIDLRHVTCHLIFVGPNSHTSNLYYTYSRYVHTSGPAEPNKSYFSRPPYISIKLAPCLHLRSVRVIISSMGKPIETLKALTAFNHDLRPVGKIWERWGIFPTIVCRKIYLILYIFLYFVFQRMYFMYT